MLPLHLITNNTRLPKSTIDSLLNNSTTPQEPIPTCDDEQQEDDAYTSPCLLITTQEDTTTALNHHNVKATPIPSCERTNTVKATPILNQNGFVEDSGIHNKFPCMYLLDMERRRKIAPFWFRRILRLHPDPVASIIPFLP